MHCMLKKLNTFNLYKQLQQSVCVGCSPIMKVKHHWDWLVLGWVTSFRLPERLSGGDVERGFESRSRQSFLTVPTYPFWRCVIQSKIHFNQEWQIFSLILLSVKPRFEALHVAQRIESQTGIFAYESLRRKDCIGDQCGRIIANAQGTPISTVAVIRSEVNVWWCRQQRIRYPGSHGAQEVQFNLFPAVSENVTQVDTKAFSNLGNYF